MTPTQQAAHRVLEQSGDNATLFRAIGDVLHMLRNQRRAARDHGLHDSANAINAMIGAVEEGRAAVMEKLLHQDAYWRSARIAELEAENEALKKRVDWLDD